MAKAIRLYYPLPNTQPLLTQNIHSFSFPHISINTKNNNKMHTVTTILTAVLAGQIAVAAVIPQRDVNPISGLPMHRTGPKHNRARPGINPISGLPMHRTGPKHNKGRPGQGHPHRNGRKPRPTVNPISGLPAPGSQPHHRLGKGSRKPEGIVIVPINRRDNDNEVNEKLVQEDEYDAGLDLLDFDYEDDESEVGNYDSDVVERGVELEANTEDSDFLANYAADKQWWEEYEKSEAADDSANDDQELELDADFLATYADDLKWWEDYEKANPSN